MWEKLQVFSYVKYLGIYLIGIPMLIILEQISQSQWYAL